MDDRFINTKRSMADMLYDKKIIKVRERYHDILLEVNDATIKEKILKIMHKDVTDIFLKMKSKNYISDFYIDNISNISIYDGADNKFRYHRFICKVIISDSSGNTIKVQYDINI